MKTDHYIVHATTVNASPKATFGTSAPVAELETAMSVCRGEQKAGKRAFITARSSDSQILHVIATAEYPVAGVARLSEALDGHPDEATPDAVNTFIDKMDWTA